MTKGKARVLLSLIAVLLVAGMIFYFSAQNGDESSDLSGRVTEWLLRVLKPGFEALSASAQREMLRAWNYIVRKGAHFTEYAALGTALMAFFTALKSFIALRATGVLSWVLGTAYAFTDELHQRLVSGRVFAVKDVMIDSAGVLTGVLLCFLLVSIIRHVFGKRSKGERFA